MRVEVQRARRDFGRSLVAFVGLLIVMGLLHRDCVLGSQLLGSAVCGALARQASLIGTLLAALGFLTVAGLGARWGLMTDRDGHDG